MPAATPAQARYNIQLISFRKQASLAEFAQRESLIGETFRLEPTGGPARWHPLLLGAFADRAAADAALESLSPRLRRLSPFVRSLSGERLVPITEP